jgi:hypothetical protein
MTIFASSFLIEFRIRELMTDVAMLFHALYRLKVTN